MVLKVFGVLPNVDWRKFNGLTYDKFILHLKECECRFNFRNENFTKFIEKLYFKNKK